MLNGDFQNNRPLQDFNLTFTGIINIFQIQIDIRRSRQKSRKTSLKNNVLNKRSFEEKFKNCIVYCNKFLSKVYNIS